MRDLQVPVTCAVGDGDWTERRTGLLQPATSAKMLGWRFDTRQHCLKSANDHWS